MTTKPKAKKFRVRTPTVPEGDGPAAAKPAAPPQAAPTTDATQAPLSRRARAAQAAASAEATTTTPPPQRTAPPTAPATVAATAPTADQSGPPAPPVGTPDEQLEAIRQEGLTGRQLRLARRVAQKHGLHPTSDFDAVRLLRAQGIDPFQRSTMLELVVPDAETSNEGAAQQALAKIDPAKIQLPQTVPEGGETLPSTELSPAERREREISEIQKDIARRRRKKMGLLVTRLAFFVALPTLIAGWYFYLIATPMYATNSQFLIIQSEGSGGAGPLGGLLPTQFATSQDAIAVQSYLTSQDAMLRLDEDVRFKEHFSQSWIDAIQRLEPDTTNQKAYKTFKKNVKIGFDPTEGVIKMEVIAADPVTSQRFSEALITYAEERVNNLSQQKRDDQMGIALAAVEQAKADRKAAQEALVRLQIEGQTLDPEGVIAGLRGQITELEALITEKNIELATLLNNARPNRARVDGARSSITILEDQLAGLNARMTDMSQGANSLAELSIRIQLAQADLATADLLLQSAIQQREQAEAEARRQVRYLTVAVRPVAPDEATYPRAFENTILAFLIFAGIYLMVSLTASILREQVSS